MLTLHHLEYSQSFRILWLLEELGGDYKLKIYNRDPKTRLAPSDYKSLSPLGTAPVITDGALTLSETNAIVDYILDRYPSTPLRLSRDHPARAQYLFWLHAAQGSMMPLLLMKTVFGVLKTRTPAIVRPLISAVLTKAEAGFLAPRMAAILDIAESDLEKSKWFGGPELSAADMVMSYGMEALSISGELDNRTHCQRWVQQMHESASFKSARKKDGRGDIAFRG